MNYESGVCFHCGKKKEEHSELVFCRDEDGAVDYLDGTTFQDSGLKKVRDNAENVLSAAEAVLPLYQFGLPIDEKDEAKFKALEAAIAQSLNETQKPNDQKEI